MEQSEKASPVITVLTSDGLFEFRLRVLDALGLVGGSEVDHIKPEIRPLVANHDAGRSPRQAVCALLAELGIGDRTISNW